MSSTASSHLTPSAPVVPLQNPSNIGVLGELKQPELSDVAHVASAVQGLVDANIIPKIDNGYSHLSQVIAKRKISTETAELTAFLNPDLERNLPDPRLMKNFDAATDLLAKAVKDGRRIAICCDYDVDGLTSGAQLQHLLLAAEADCKVFVPERFKGGYGLSSEMVRKIAKDGFDLMVTLDFGTKNIAELNLARELGLQTIVIDHHNAPDEPCPADYLVNPKQQGCGYADGILSTSGISWLLTRELSTRLNLSPQISAENLSLAALGTICDVMQLTGINRALVQRGLAELSKSNLPGVKALLEILDLSGEITVRDIQFSIGPVLNAAGRMRSANLVVDLLTAPEQSQAKGIASELKELNDLRKDIQNTILTDCAARVNALPTLPPVIVLWDERFHSGVVGAVAQQLVDKFNRPVFLMGGSAPRTLAGSARGLPGISLTDALTSCQDLLLKFGGHDQAAGFSVSVDNAEKLQQRLEQYASSMKFAPRQPRAFEADLILRLGEIDFAMLAEFNALEPCGPGNERVRVELQGLRVLAVDKIKERYLSVLLSDGHQQLKAFCFSADHGALTIDSVVDVIGTLNISNWNGGRHTIELSLEQARTSSLTSPNSKAKSANGIAATWERELIADEQRLKEIVRLLMTRSIIAVDTETYGWREGKQIISLVQIGDPEEHKTYLIDAVVLGGIQELKPLLENDRVIKVEHNGFFESERFKEISIIQRSSLDTMLLAKKLLPELPNHKLGTCVKYLLGIDISKDEQRGDWRIRPLSASQIAYAALDPEITYKLYQALVDLQTQAEVVPAATLPERMAQWYEAQMHSDHLTQIKAPFLSTLQIRREELRDLVRGKLRNGALEYNGEWGETRLGSIKRAIVPSRFREALLAAVCDSIGESKVHEICDGLLRISKKELKGAFASFGLAQSIYKEVEAESFVRDPEPGAPTIQCAYKKAPLTGSSPHFKRLELPQLMHELALTENSIYQNYHANPELLIATARSAILRSAVSSMVSDSPGVFYKGPLGEATKCSHQQVFQLDRLRNVLAKHVAPEVVEKLIETLPFKIFKGEAEEVLGSKPFEALGLVDPESRKEFFKRVMRSTGEQWPASITSVI